MAGTEAAGDFLLSPARMEPLLERVRDAHHHLRPFEILLKTKKIAASASDLQVLSECVHS